MTNPARTAAAVAGRQRKAAERRAEYLRERGWICLAPETIKAMAALTEPWGQGPAHVVTLTAAVSAEEYERISQAIYEGKGNVMAKAPKSGPVGDQSGRRRGAGTAGDNPDTRSGGDSKGGKVPDNVEGRPVGRGEGRRKG